MTKRVNHTHEMLKDLKDSHEVLDHESDAKVVATFYYSLTDKNGGTDNWSQTAVDNIELSSIPLTDENYNNAVGTIFWEGSRLSAPNDGKMSAMYKEDGNLALPNGSVHLSQIYPDSGTGMVTTVPRVVFMVTATQGEYDGFPFLNMIIEYDNDGTIFGDGSRKRLRRLRLVKGDHKKLLEEEDAAAAAEATTSASDGLGATE